MVIEVECTQKLDFLFVQLFNYIKRKENEKRVKTEDIGLLFGGQRVREKSVCVSVEKKRKVIETKELSSRLIFVVVFVSFSFASIFDLARAHSSGYPWQMLMGGSGGRGGWGGGRSRGGRRRGYE